MNNINSEGLHSDLPLEVILNTSRPVSVDVQLKLYDIFIPIIGILIILFNLAIVISSGLILKRGQEPRSTYLFLGNVALADLVIGVAVLLGQFYPKPHRGEMSCAIQIGMTVSSAITSVYSVGLIAVDRYLYILYGLQYQRYIYPNRARIMILMTWILGLIIGFLPAMGIRGDTDNGRLCWFIILTPPDLVLITTTIGVIPLFVIIILYSIILRYALKKISELKSAAKDNKGTRTGKLRLFRGGQHSNDSKLSIIPDVRENQRDSIEKSSITKNSLTKWFRRKTIKRNDDDIKIAPVYNPSKWKAIKIVLFTTGSFFITWFPFFVASALFAVCDPEKSPRFCDGLRVAIASPLAILGLTNSLLNPIIYAWWHNGFRESIKKIYHGIFATKFNLKDNGQSKRRTMYSSNGNFMPRHSTTDVESSDLEPGSIRRNEQIHQNGDQSDYHSDHQSDHQSVRNNRRPVVTTTQVEISQ